ncbi:hypothetical protein MATL_G00177320 [Megalops atlanticus]|uniref:Uncharacterized protein n=1 Tax=Megalops atlanticus TaxID=7932 RepID=A0A9D3PLK7_MEGAT|nr:hypothetical protein MATL_G00177320 [Megalops atlanticus]
MRNSGHLGRPGIMLLLVTCPLLAVLQGATSKAESGHLGDSSPDRCMRHHFVETITHPIYKCNSKPERSSLNPIPQPLHEPLSGVLFDYERNSDKHNDRSPAESRPALIQLPWLPRALRQRLHPRAAAGLLSAPPQSVHGRSCIKSLLLTRHLALRLLLKGRSGPRGANCGIALQGSPPSYAERLLYEGVYYTEHWRSVGAAEASTHRGSAPQQPRDAAHLHPDRVL